MSTSKKVSLSLAFAVVIFSVTYLTKKEVTDIVFVSLGDAFVMLAACFLPSGFAMLAALIGCGASAFLIGGWEALITVAAFRVLVACWFMDDEDKLLTFRTGIGLIMSTVICSLGSFFYILLKNHDFTSAPMNILYVCSLAAVINVVLFAIIALIFDRLKIKQKLQ